MTPSSSLERRRSRCRRHLQRLRRASTSLPTAANVTRASTSACVIVVLCIDCCAPPPVTQSDSLVAVSASSATAPAAARYAALPSTALRDNDDQVEIVLDPDDDEMDMGASDDGEVCTAPCDTSTHTHMCSRVQDALQRLQELADEHSRSLRRGVVPGSATPATSGGAFAQLPHSLLVNDDEAYARTQTLVPTASHDPALGTVYDNESFDCNDVRMLAFAWYHGGLSKEEATSAYWKRLCACGAVPNSQPVRAGILMAKPAGAFLVRDSSQPGCFAVSLRSPENVRTSRLIDIDV
jgi:hypothetical protein